MPSLLRTLTNRLAGAGRIAVLAVGSELRSDDAAAILVGEELENILKRSKRGVPIKVFVGGTAPENVTGQIRDYAPTHIIIIDSLDVRRPSGTVMLVDPADLGSGVTFSTHTMPARILADYFSGSLNCRVTMAGIQPRSLKFGGAPSKSVISSARRLAIAISRAREGLTN